jgi:SAM-dependent methyltransferase
MSAKLNLNFYSGEDHYSDGDIEDELLDIIKSKREVEDVLSEHDNWAILYHLSPIRQNILNWYPFKKEACVLEIGGGCGAITGALCEKVDSVKVVELSKRRSTINLERNGHYDNLEIIVGNLNDIKFEQKFDYITLIGVLEYAGKFTKGDTPFESFLKNIKNYLKPNGQILIAIENKFGMKYWAGAREDHTGKLFDSIEDYPNNKSTQTFGKWELEQLCKKAGFKNINFYYPMPDYKLPKIIYSDSYLPDIEDIFDIYSPNFDQDRYLLFNEREAFKNIIKNNNFPFFANSFLIEVSE